MAEDLLLPEGMRLPDLSQTRRVDREFLDGLVQAGLHAVRWGPDVRNGCVRLTDGVRGLYWALQTVNADGEAPVQSPDPWTPSDLLIGDRAGVLWRWNGATHRDGDQPAIIDEEQIEWRSGGVTHRAHAPAVFYGFGGHVWWWRNWVLRPDRPTERRFARLRVLLEDAWALRVSDDRARDLLAEAERLGRDDLPVLPQVWVAHVLAGNQSADLDASTRAWLRLLTA